MEPIAEPRDRFNLRKALLRVERDIKALEEQDIHTLDQSVLTRCRVRALPLSLDAGDSLAPKFFTSFAPSDMPEPTPEFVDREYNTDELTLSSERGRLIYLYLKSYVSEMIVDFPEVHRTWSSKQYAPSTKGSTPCLGLCLLIHSVSPGSVITIFAICTGRWNLNMAPYRYFMLLRPPSRM